jgi:hypothetical protein
MRYLLLLLGEVVLDLLLVEKLSTVFESEGQFLFEIVAVRLKLKSMLVLELAEGLSVLLLGLEKILIPLLIEFLILLNMGLLALLSLLSLIEDELLITTIIVLLLEFLNSVLGHLSLDILALTLASSSMFLEDLAVIEKFKQLDNSVPR